MVRELSLVFLVALAAELFTTVQCGAIPNEPDLVYFGSSNNPEKSVTFPESLYFVSRNDAGYASATGDCEAFLGADGTLLIIETQEELENVTKFLDRDDTAAKFWIGAGYDINKKSFVWANDVQLGPWAPWAAGHPQTQLEVTKVALNAVGGVQFETQFQTESTRYLCELRLSNEQAVPCYSDNDLVIVVDSSGSIGQQDYMLALEFTAKLAIAWADNPGNRLSVVIYSDDAISIISMSEILSVSEIRDRVYNTPYLAGWTYSDKGLGLAVSEITLNSRDVPKNIVLLTDGESTDPAATLVAAQQVQDAGIRAFAVGIKDRVNSQELLAIAGNNPDYVFNTDSFKELLTLLQPVSERVCD